MATAHPATLADKTDQDAASVDLPLAGWWRWPAYFVVGMALGIVFVKSEVLSWYRIQEMFRFHSFYMYGVIGTAVAVAALARAVLARIHRGSSREMQTPAKEWTPLATRYWLGGIVFGMGWALLGACPGPIFTLIGGGHFEFIVPLLSALAGTYAYGAVRHRLPH